MTRTVDAPALVAVRGLRKSFGGTTALAGVDLEISPGEVHALVGPNGSGKSTLIKILAGYHVPEAGSVYSRDSELRLPLRPGEAARHGLSFLHQDAPVAGPLTIAENVRVGRYSGNPLAPLWGRRERDRVRELLRSVGLSVDPDRRAADLPQAERALVSFAAAAAALPEHGGVLVLDEPTACLPPSGAERMFAAIRRFTAAGSGVLFVSHRLDEVLAIADRISVLREGRLVGTVRAADTTRAEIVAMMLGRELTNLYPEKGATPHDAVLTAHGVRGRLIDGVDIQVRAGEVCGVTGLVGMGQDELPYLLYGALPLRAGTVTVRGRPVRRVRPADMRAAGVALLPADRSAASGVLDATVQENITLPVLGRFFAGGRLRHRRETGTVRDLLGRFQVRPVSPQALLGRFSGGNQQKVLLAKWMQAGPAVLLLHEPTQGVDIGSRGQIFRIIEEAAVSGVAVLIASAEYGDLAHLCDRVLVLHRGRAVAALSGDQLSEDAIIHACLTAGDHPEKRTPA